MIAVFEAGGFGRRIEMGKPDGRRRVAGAEGAAADRATVEVAELPAGDVGLVSAKAHVADRSPFVGVEDLEAAFRVFDAVDQAQVALDRGSARLDEGRRRQPKRQCQHRYGEDEDSCSSVVVPRRIH